MTRLTALAMLAAPQPGDPDPSTGRGPEWGKAAPIGLLVILLLAVAVFFLLRSFTRQLKKVPASFDTDESESVGPVAPIAAGSVSDAGPSSDAARADAGRADARGSPPGADGRDPAGPDDPAG